MLVSVIIPTYNSEKYLNETINSVINQTYRELEIVCVDNGSSDSTIQIIEDFIKKNDKIRLLKESRKGANYARNHGLKEIKGKFVQFLDSDDYIEPDKIKLQVEKMKEGNYDLVLCNRANFDENLTLKQKAFDFKNILSHPLETCICDIIITGNPLYKTEAIKQINGWDESLSSAQDWELHIRMALNNFKFGFIDEYLLKSRIHKNSLSYDWIKVNNSCILVLNRNLSLIIHHPEYPSLKIKKRVFYTYYLGSIFSKTEHLNSLSKWGFEKEYNQFLSGWSKIFYTVFGLKSLVKFKSVISRKRVN